MSERMPDGVMAYLEHGTTAADQVVAEALSAVGDPETYERALERQATRKPAVRQSGRPFMTILTEALDSNEEG
jgi:hypothetical protein